MANNLCVWFEIPVADVDRARKFYSEVTGLEVTEGQGMGENVMAFFPMSDEWDNSGALSMGPQMNPGGNGCYVYLNGGEDLAEPLSRVEPAGGQVMIPKTAIGDGMGFFAVFIDTEGNQVGLWSPR
jgi:predicted enzyme related to lactoylglutathione lyase